MQSLVNAWIVEIHYAIKQGCVRLRNALKCINITYIGVHLLIYRS